MCDRPSDGPLDEPDATVRHLHCDLRQRIGRFKGDAKVIDLYRHRLAQDQLRHDLAMAFGSMDAGKYDDDKEGA